MFKVKNKDKHQNNVNDFNFVNSVNLEYILPFSSVSIVEFEQVSVCWGDNEI